MVDRRPPEDAPADAPIAPGAGDVLDADADDFLTEILKNVVAAQIPTDTGGGDDFLAPGDISTTPGDLSTTQGLPIGPVHDTAFLAQTGGVPGPLELGQYTTGVGPTDVLPPAHTWSPAGSGSAPGLLTATPLYAIPPPPTVRSSIIRQEQVFTETLQLSGAVVGQQTNPSQALSQYQSHTGHQTSHQPGLRTSLHTYGGTGSSFNRTRSRATATITRPPPSPDETPGPTGLALPNVADMLSSVFQTPGVPPTEQPLHSSLPQASLPAPDSDIVTISPDALSDIFRPQVGPYSQEPFPASVSQTEPRPPPEPSFTAATPSSSPYLNVSQTSQSHRSQITDLRRTIVQYAMPTTDPHISQVPKPTPDRGPRLRSPRQPAASPPRVFTFSPRGADGGLERPRRTSSSYSPGFLSSSYSPGLLSSSSPLTSPVSSASPSPGLDRTSESKADHVRERLLETLQRRRGSSALDDTHHEPSSEEHELTPQEREKKMRRREQNRRAAQKCRLKKRADQETVVSEYRRLHNTNTGLRQEIKKLAEQKDSLEQTLGEHLQECTWRVQPSRGRGVGVTGAARGVGAPRGAGRRTGAPRGVQIVTESERLDTDMDSDTSEDEDKAL